MIELQSPPYPGDVTTARGLYEAMLMFRSWVEWLWQISEEETNCKCLEERKLAELPGLEKHLSHSVLTHYFLYTGMRVFREQWDRLVRNSEDCWEAKIAKTARHSILIESIEFMDVCY